MIKFIRSNISDKYIFKLFLLILWFCALGHACRSFTVDIGDILTINSDLGTMEFCGKRNCSNLTDMAYVESKIQITKFTFCKDIFIYGKLKLFGKRPVSIKSCKGDIIINSTSRIRVHCTDVNGRRTDCLGTKRCGGDHSGNFSIVILYTEFPNSFLY